MFYDCRGAGFDPNGGAYVWEAESGGIVFTLGDHKDAITSFSWRADSRMLTSFSQDGRVILLRRRRLPDPFDQRSD